MSSLTLVPGAEPEPASGATVSASEARRSIDDLIAEAWQYRSSADYLEMLDFIGGFRMQAPFNALLLHIQCPGARFVATAQRWRAQFGRQVKPGERPLVVLRPFGPVAFVYDVAQTEPAPDAPELPGMVEAPFAMPPIRGVDDAVRWTILNAERDGVRVVAARSGPQRAGCIRASAAAGWRYEIEHNGDFPPTEVYTTLAHELGHLYCGHLGTPNPKWWPDRRRTPEAVMEFEAESVAAIACKRLDAHAQLPPHLAQYLQDQPVVPDGVSLDRVMTAAGRVIDMAAGKVRPRAA